MSAKVEKVPDTNSETQLSLARDTDWLKVLFQIQITLSVFVALHFLLYECYWSTIFFTLFVVFLGHIGVAAGSHRLWAHRSYTAEGSLKIFLVICQTLSGTGSIYEWVQWHRLHHKYFGKDLDPFNPSRGWLYSHVQSTGLNLSPAQEAELKKIDMSDLEADKLIMFQKKWYVLLYLVVYLLLPINAPAEYWGENLYSSTFLVGFLRIFINMQLSWLIHSASLIWGLKSGEKYPCDTNLVFILTKSNWLSYHYIAPWDYQTSEYGQYGSDTISKFIRMCAALELASDLKTVDSTIVRKGLAKSITEQKNITECFLELSKENNNVPKDHYLHPKDYY